MGKLFVVAASAVLGLAAANNDWQHKSWQTQSWQKPQKYEVEYGFDTAVVKYCDHNNYHNGKYMCVRGQEDSYGDLCRFSYVTDCERNDKDAKIVRKFWKKIYYDESFERECNENPHYWYSDYVENRWHRSLKATAAAAAGEPMVRAKGASGLRNDGWQKNGGYKYNWQQCPCPEQPYVEYGYDELTVAYCDEKDYHTGKYACVKAEDDDYDGLCRYDYVKDCDGKDDCYSSKKTKKVRRYWKKVYYDESFERECSEKQHYFGNGWSNWQPSNEWSSWHGNDWSGGEGKWTNVWHGRDEWNSWGKNGGGNGGSWGKHDGGNNNWNGHNGNGGRHLSGEDSWNSWDRNQQWNGWQSQRWNNWQGNSWNGDYKNSWGNRGNDWNNNWLSQSWNSWQPNCYVPSVPRYEYGYDVVYVTFCDEKDYHTGEYACIKGEDDKHEDMCRYHYVKRCDKDDHKAKPVKLYWKKIYFDREFEHECKQYGHYWNGWQGGNNWNNNWNGHSNGNNWNGHNNGNNWNGK